MPVEPAQDRPAAALPAAPQADAVRTEGSPEGVGFTLRFTVPVPSIEVALLVEAHDAVTSALRAALGQGIGGGLAAGPEPVETAQVSGHLDAVDVLQQPNRLAVEVAVASPAPADVTESLEVAGRIVADLSGVIGDILGLAGTPALPIARLEVLTPAERANALQAEREASDLVGVAEIAELRGAMRQAVQRQTRYADFPDPVAVLKAGPVYLKRDVLDYYARRASATHAGTPDGRTPSRQERTQLTALLTEFLNDHPELADSPTAGPWLSAVHRPHLLHGNVLASALHILGGSTTVAAALGVQPRTVQRWLVRAEGRERT